MSAHMERKTALVPKVLDTFLFTHEFDLLELRLRTLWPVVDKFLLMEGDHNFANKPKPMRFDEQRARFDWAKDKLTILHHVGPFKDYVIPLPGQVPPYGGGELFVEHQHRQCLYDNAKVMPGFLPDDIMLISDVDELPSREVIERLKAEDFTSPTLLKQDFYYYNIKCHRGMRWDGSIATRFGHDVGDIGRMRGKRNKMVSIDSNCGWHLAHFFDAEGIREKLQHSSHQHYNSETYYAPEHLKTCVQENKSYLGKADGNLPPEPLPAYLINEMKRFPIMMGEEWR